MRPANSRSLTVAVAALLPALLVAPTAAAQARTAQPAVPAARGATPAAIPARPEKLVFKPLRWEPPDPQAHRVALRNGVVVYLAEDPELPLVSVQALLRTGQYLEPAGKEGLAAATGELLRAGGTQRLTAEALDERLDLLATSMGTAIGETAGNAGFNCLAEHLDESLALFVEVLKSPRFQEDRLALYKERTLQELRQRNDDAADIEALEWNMLLNGPGHFTNRLTTQASLAALTRDDLVAFHRRSVHPARTVLAVSGAFRRDDMLRRLEAAFESWPWQAQETPPVPAELDATATPGLYRIHKPVNQGRVAVGLVTARRDIPDAYALEVMNEILGGGGFVSRITRSVRSNEGLAYSAGSRLTLGAYYPGRFRAAFQSKSRSVAYATQLVLREIASVRDQPVSASELETVKQNLIEGLPGQFSGSARRMLQLASDEFSGRAPDYWKRYRERIAAVTAADVQRVARQYLVPGKLVALVVGDLAEIAAGDPQHPVKLEELFPGRPTDLTLRDPLTLHRQR